MLSMMAALPLLLALLLPGCRAAGDLPNIIHIMGDDVGWNDLGYHNDLITSPWIDKLALGGVRLTNHHAFKVCAPSRSGFHTGRLPWQMGYYDNSGAATPWETVDSNKLGADPRFKLLPQLLETKGYVSHAIGKWHLGGAARAYTPTYRGYSSFLGYYHAMTEDYWAHTHSTGSNCPGPGLGGLWSDMSNNTGTTLGMSPDNGTYESVLFGDHAVRTIGAHGRVGGDAPPPLFMYIAFHNEHDPHQAPKPDIDQFEAVIRSDTYKVTAAQISTMDLQIGRIYNALQDASLLDNCIIGFSSDNGGPLDHANNFPHRGGKHGFYEGGVRTQAFIWWSKMPKAAVGSHYDGLAHVADWRATYASGVAGITAATIASLEQAPFQDESKDHWAAMTTGAPVPRTELVHHLHSPKYYPGNCTQNCWGGRNCPAVITSGDLKLMLGYVGDPRRLTMNESTGGARVPFGATGGECGLAGFAERCQAGHLLKPDGHPATAPKPSWDDPDGINCLSGCLFNLTADVSESENLINHTKHAADVARLKQRLVEVGATAPPWFQAPELSKYSSGALGSALCDAAHKAQGVQPIDF